MFKQVCFWVFFLCPFFLGAEQFSPREQGLVANFWSKVKEQKFHSLKHMMDPHFICYDAFGDRTHRSKTIQTLRALHLSDFQIQNLRLCQTKGVLIANYILRYSVRELPNQYVSIAQTSTFKWVRHTWLVHTQANYTAFLNSVEDR